MALILGAIYGSFTAIGEHTVHLFWPGATKLKTQAVSQMLMFDDVPELVINYGFKHLHDLLQALKLNK